MYLILMGIFPHSAFTIICILIISSANAEMSFSPIHGNAGSIHFSTDVIAFYSFEFFKQFWIRLHSQLICLRNIIRKITYNSATTCNSFLYFPFPDSKQSCHIVTQLIIPFRQYRYRQH